MKRTNRKFSMESLERREVFSATVIEVEVNDTKAQANNFELDAADVTADLIGTSQNDEDKDWFRFTVPQDGTLTATVSSPNGEFAALEVERGDGSEVMSTDPNDGIHTASRAVAAGEQLFVRLRAKDDRAAQYVANLTLGEGGGPGGPGGDPQVGTTTEVENNDRKSRATLFALDGNGTAQLLGTSTSDNDKDYFRFTLPADGDLSVMVNSANGNFAQFQIEDRFGNDLMETQPNDGVNSGSVTLAGGEDYFIRMRSKNDAAAEYSVDIQTSAASGPVLGGNDKIGAGSSLDGTEDGGFAQSVSHRNQCVDTSLALPSVHLVETLAADGIRLTDRYDAIDEALAELEI